jgi:hypothetical protein
MERDKSPERTTKEPLIARGTTPSNKPRVTHSRIPYPLRFDEIVIKTEPYFRQGAFSSNWRLDFKIFCKFKGRIVEEQFNNPTMHVALANALCMLEMDGYTYTKGVCDQNGCSEVATTFYKLKHDYCDHGNEVINDNTILFRGFCEAHKNRGTQGLSDVQSNYEPFEMLQEEVAPIQELLLSESARALLLPVSVREILPGSAREPLMRENI